MDAMQDFFRCVGSSLRLAEACKLALGRLHQFHHYALETKYMVIH